MINSVVLIVVLLVVDVVVTRLDHAVIVAAIIHQWRRPRSSLSSAGLTMVQVVHLNRGL